LISQQKERANRISSGEWEVHKCLWDGAGEKRMTGQSEQKEDKNLGQRATCNVRRDDGNVMDMREDILAPPKESGGHQYWGKEKPE